MIVACDVTRNEICNQELLVIDLLVLESRWLRTVIVGEVLMHTERHSGCIYWCPIYQVPEHGRFIA